MAITDRPSDFLSGEPMAAYFYVDQGEGRTLGIATQGETANKRIQRALNDYFAGRNVVQPLTVDGVIGDRTLSALDVAAREHESAAPGSGYSQIRSVIQADRRNRTIAPLSYRWGLWLAYVRPEPTLRGRDYSAVVIPTGTRLPIYGQAPDDDRDAGGANLLATTWQVGTQPAPNAPIRSETRTPTGSTAPSSSALAPTTPGTPNASRPTAALETKIAGVQAKYWLAGALAVGVGALAVSSSSKGRRRRSSSSRTTTVVYRRR